LSAPVGQHGTNLQDGTCAVLSKGFRLAYVLCTWQMSSTGLSKIVPIAGLSFYVRALVLKSHMYAMTVSLLLSCLEVMV